MRCTDLVVATALTLLPGIATAQFAGYYSAGTAPILACDFRTGGAPGAGQNTYVFGPQCPPVLFNRAGPKAEFLCSAGGKLSSLAADVIPAPACDPLSGSLLGLGIEGPSTISNKFARDLTNSAWTKNHITAALTQVGIDGQANSASLLTATAPNGTVCYPFGVSALQRVDSLFVRRVSGTGEVDFSVDAATWSALPVAGTFRRLPRGGSYSTVANAQFCLRLVTNGDQVAVDYVNDERDLNTLYVAPTSPVVTTSTANVIRAADTAWLDLTKVAGWNPDHWTVTAQYMLPQWVVPSDAGTNGRRAIFEVDDGTGENGFFINNQTDGYTNPQCKPGTIGPLHCPDFNIDGRAGNVPFTAGKRRATVTPVPAFASELPGLAPPGAGQFASVAVSYDAALGTCIVVNTGGAPTMMSNGQYFQSGNTPPECTQIPTSPAIPLGLLGRLVIGAAPNEATVITGSATVNDVLSLSAAWEDPQGTSHSETLSYTVPGGDTTTIAAAFASLINADAVLAASGVTATSSANSVLPRHRPGLFIQWTTGYSAGATGLPLAEDNVGRMFGYVQTVTVYPVALRGSDLTAVLPATSPVTVRPSYPLYNRGGNITLNVGGRLQCNNC